MRKNKESSQEDVNVALQKLASSPFRAKFTLKEKELNYIQEKVWI